MSRLGRWRYDAILLAPLILLVGWPAAATLREAIPPAYERQSVSGIFDRLRSPGNAEGQALPPPDESKLPPRVGGATTGLLARPARLARETVILVAATEVVVMPLGLILAPLLFRTDVWGRNGVIALFLIAALIPLPLLTTAWLGTLGNPGRLQAIGLRPLLVGRFGAVVIHTLAALPWVVLIAGVGFRTVERELEESACLDLPPTIVWLRITIRRALGAIAAAALTAAVLTAGEMTVTDLLQIRTYAEESYVQYSLGRGPAAAAAVALPPLLVLGSLIFTLALVLARADPHRVASSWLSSKTWELGKARRPLGALLLFIVGNLLLVPIYGLVWRAGRVGGKAPAAIPPPWRLEGLLGTIRMAAEESWEPLATSLTAAFLAATLAVMLAWPLVWQSRWSSIWRVLTLAIAALLLAVPGPVAGMSLVLAYREVPPVYDSLAIVVFAQAQRILPYAILILWPAVRGISPRFLENAAIDGFGEARRVWNVALPLSRTAVGAAWLVGFVLAFGELPATNLVQPPGVTLISFRIWSLLHTGVESHLAGVALVTLSVVVTIGLIAALGLRRLALTIRRYASAGVFEGERLTPPNQHP
jgi:iron(III) transport system permease protein